MVQCLINKPVPHYLISFFFPPFGLGNGWGVKTVITRGNASNSFLSLDFFWNFLKVHL